MLNKFIVPAALAAMLILPTTALAQQTGPDAPVENPSDTVPDTPPDSESKTQEGMDLLGEGARLLFEGLSEGIRPQLEEMAREMEPALRNMMETMGPALSDLAEMIGDLNAYHPPERLPNGDIILRRKTPPPPDDSAPPKSGDPIDL